jgi:hypothetical protein
MSVLKLLATAALEKSAKASSGQGALNTIKNQISVKKAEPSTRSPEDIPNASDIVDGLRVRGTIPDMGSIGATLSNYKVLPGVREVDFSLFGGPDPLTNRTKSLMEQIGDSGEINPLIVVFDKKGPYILEGAHRYDALQHLGKTKFPAKIVLDLD